MGRVHLRLSELSWSSKAFFEPESRALFFARGPADIGGFVKFKRHAHRRLGELLVSVRTFSCSKVKLTGPGAQPPRVSQLSYRCHPESFRPSCSYSSELSDNRPAQRSCLEVGVKHFSTPTKLPSRGRYSSKKPQVGLDLAEACTLRAPLAL